MSMSRTVAVLCFAVALIQVAVLLVKVLDGLHISGAEPVALVMSFMAAIGWWRADFYGN